MDGRPKRIKKFAFTSVCVYNRLRVDGASVRFECLDDRAPLMSHLWLSFFNSRAYPCHATPKFAN